MALRIEYACPGFFHLKMKNVEVESDPNTGRVYFIHRGLIVAVARRA